MTEDTWAVTSTDSGVDRAPRRRTFLRVLGGVCAAGPLAGCTSTGDGNSGGNGNANATTSEATTDQAGTTPSTSTARDDGSGPESVAAFLADTSNFDGVVDRTGESGITVAVGSEANGAFFGFEPPAVRVDPGTTVTWEWSGNGGPHNVAAVAGATFESQVTATEGHTFERTFTETSTIFYVCQPHRGTGMKGAVVVEAP